MIIKKTFQSNFATLHTTDSSQVLLSTAIKKILGSDGNSHTCRVLLDSRSQVHFLTEKLVKRLGLKTREIELPLGGVNQMTSNIDKVTRTVIKSRLNKYSAELTFLVTAEINGHTPMEPIIKLI